MAAQAYNLMALDIGERRIGVARANAGIGIASPLATLERSDSTTQDIRKLLKDNNANVLVVGLPRGLEGQETAQTAAVRKFAEQLKAHINIPLRLQDEALTSRKAEAELNARGKAYKKSDVDALAATYILEDYIAEHSKGIHA
jgi:putative pre-16S rRNA nuclease